MVFLKEQVTEHFNMDTVDTRGIISYIIDSILIKF